MPREMQRFISSLNIYVIEWVLHQKQFLDEFFSFWLICAWRNVCQKCNCSAFNQCTRNECVQYSMCMRQTLSENLIKFISAGSMVETDQMNWVDKELSNWPQSVSCCRFINVKTWKIARSRRVICHRHNTYLKGATINYHLCLHIPFKTYKSIRFCKNILKRLSTIN